MSERTLPHPTSTTESAQPFPADAENLYLSLVRQAQSRRNPLQPLNPDEHQRGLATYRMEYGIEDIELRLGNNRPRLSWSQEVAVLHHFAARYDSLPTSHTRYGSSTDHNHSNELTDCGKIHGPTQRFLEGFTHKLGDRLGSRKAKAAWLIGMRSLLFCICPGDDITAIVAQTITGAGHSFEQTAGNHQELAILNRRPYIVRRKSGEEQEL